MSSYTPSLCFMFFCLSCLVHHVPSMHHSSSVHFSCCTLPHSTHLNHSQQPTISSLFYIFILSVHLLHPLFTILLHALLMSSALPDHHCNSSASLAVHSCIHHHWVVCWDSLACLVVKTLHLLWRSPWSLFESSSRNHQSFLAVTLWTSKKMHQQLNRQLSKSHDLVMLTES